MSEEWRDIPGFEGSYQVSDLGRVRSLDRVVGTVNGQMRRYRGFLLKNGATTKGYRMVALGKGNSVYVHAVVAQAFLGPQPTPAHEVAHWDGRRANNVPGNLRWATRKENMEDMARHGTRPGPRVGSIRPPRPGEARYV